MTFAQLMADMQEVQDKVQAEHVYELDPVGTDAWQYLGPGEKGDCEDFALTKLKLLLEKGFPIESLKIEVGLIPPNAVGHAWLTVLTDRGNYSLDLNHAAVTLSDELEYYGRYIQTGPDWQHS
jgi:predicted transglutaminase-like cysteine proteinase